MEEPLDAGLWNPPVVDPDQSIDTAMLIEQYKTYVSLADKVSERRSTANSFFLAIHSAAVAVLAVLWKDRPVDVSPWLLILPCVIQTLVCIWWWTLLQRYRKLNSVKFAVVGALERQLPASPWWAEYQELKRQASGKGYPSLARVESMIPIAFGALYIGGLVVAVSA
ncbi:hypothetical protein [Lentzea sp. NPDC092896]|uniref:RipA family octameric membrane protein n=1 Tax=Lentzea sp. NPDC092896 TaxID=3364127 RepID=UPI003800CE6A